ncbi:Carbonic anhydrase [Smittium mucronatum]|uniref:Carbonic anhydrase n=1 Tax=Smittium mucronatum TaxID=133383 RepID=A0A1R0GSN4_9FUNG|nr:Carbonic anhydrase [Smittium mucronatum]
MFSNKGSAHPATDLSAESATLNNCESASALPPLERLIYLNEDFVNKTLAQDPKYFTNLTLNQNPSILYIGCSDSRVTIDVVTESHPGDIFEHRNIANSVTLDDVDTLAVIQYSVEDLHIKDIVISGHTYCGGIKAVLSGYDSLTGALSEWLAPIKQLYDDNRATLDAISDPYLQARTLTEMNVNRVVNLVNGLDIVTGARDNGQTVNIHGWIFLMESGLYHDMKITKSAN